MFEHACRVAGLRLTHQRLEIYRELALSGDHPSAETLHQRLRKKVPTISLDTVYRTLATFARHGLINKVETTESQAQFEATGIRHHHLICSKLETTLTSTVDLAKKGDFVGATGAFKKVEEACAACHATFQD